MTVKGILIPIGGNEDKGLVAKPSYKMDFISDGILSHVVKESGGTKANILVLPAASSIPEEVGDNYIQAFKTLGCNNVKVLHIKKRKHADKPEFLEALKQADCVMFSGGDQRKISAKIYGSEFHKLLTEKYQHEAFVIAGTSAGAMAMAKEMISGGSSKEAFIKGAVQMSQGLELIPELIIDTHFIQRGRFGRQSEAVAKFPKLLGIGLAEDTGLIIKNGKDIKVIGSGMAIVFDPQHIGHNNEKVLREGTPMTMTNLIVHILANGDRFDIETREVKVLPIEAPFV
ncbi:cyanophycinase [Gelidibacter algens]|jgi:cyanophycinase|uniref:Cyanophycinase n=1 Tax=Gelidibacter algens TaxID=49280 RepID=A0A1A7R2U3_9FLAO|nr:cyanophycinase [Gelidibacter algens]OBX25087.1 cyanophycinase [Gelidibacter algens]RAJ23024.1 cyanophycinase [Gelidibacter algens]